MLAQSQGTLMKLLKIVRGKNHICNLSGFLDAFVTEFVCIFDQSKGENMISAILTDFAVLLFIRMCGYFYIKLELILLLL